MGTVNVVIGSGYAAAESIMSMRSSGFSGEIHLLSDTGWLGFNPMLTSYYLSGKVEFNELFPFGKSEDFAREYDVNMHMGSPVIELDTKKKSVTNANGEKIHYDKCLICSGAETIKPKIHCEVEDLVFTLRTVEEMQALEERLTRPVKNAVIAGASMVGVKMAEMLANRGSNVSFVDLAPHIFSLAAHENCSVEIEERLRNKQIDLYFNHAIEKIQKSSDGAVVQLSGYADLISTDLVIMCVGVRPRVGFLDRNEISVDRGILVDEYMRTSVSDVYAAGDVAQGRNMLTGENQIIGLLANARYQGRTAGRNMAGQLEKYPGNIPHNTTHFFDMEFMSAGDMHSGDRMTENKEGDKYAAFCFQGKRLCGMNLLNMPEVSGILKNYFVKVLETNEGIVPEKLQGSSLILNQAFSEYPWLETILGEGK
ncbi:NAD(P)/FAD-dependent oxidoreductase [Parasporobacterium paucivorans]|uniref:Pyridine nucleotide-disulphide oxidoreductase n=1 Tax=Parasporobacterium paucivorans DSM 15970 TaxID=1122934 RepID=A0A1M6IGP0_9FIRM|nr:NAD(P)/FAD-dependent oxidoreductase [Parasporobacterium paucivorans]SHJ33613.1 Pyridine nucleotide-disulphide oxidoreductase [Parasporobacterium paucivorans DSM 15970]